MEGSARPSRRERYREQTLAEIKSIALRQVVEGGEAALSLNAAAREMGMSGAALYRYFDSRDDLLAELGVDAYEALADALEQAAAKRRRSPEARLRAVADAYRDWALAQPHRFRLVFSTQLGSGRLAPERVIPAAQRSMDVLLKAIAAFPAGTAGPSPDLPAALRDQLGRWHTRSGGPDLPAHVLRCGVEFWTRLHGLVSLELEGGFAVMGLDPGLLYDTEVSDIIAGMS